MVDWKPGTSAAALKLRADLLAATRAFFAERGVMEVETPLLSAATVTDINLDSFALNTAAGIRYLQTSPEYAMKRLLAAGSGPIYQICKAFRQDESSRLHNNEFTMLEWYRPGFRLEQLMDEVDALLTAILETGPLPRFSYAELFLERFDQDPHSIEFANLKALAHQHIDLASTELDATDYLQLLMLHCIEPELPELCLVYDYPAAQAALAEVEADSEGRPVARRFEVYGRGMELANAYQELTDAAEQRQRFARDLAAREIRGKHLPAADERLLAALAQGLPPCSGIALGFDRLVMLAAGSERIDEVIAFSDERA